MGSICSVPGGKAEQLPLIRRCEVGDDDAWEILVGLVMKRLFCLSYSFTHCREDAEDLTQEVLIRVYRNLHQFRQGTGSLQSWVVAIARNLIVDNHRQIRRLPCRIGIEEVERLDMAEKRLTDPLHAAEQAEVSAFVRYGLRRLPPHLRQAVQLKDIEEMEYREIATRLRVAEGTIKSRVNRGRLQLARIMRARLPKQLKPSAGSTSRRTQSDTALRPPSVLTRRKARPSHLGIGVKTIMRHSSSSFEVSPA